MNFDIVIIKIGIYFQRKRSGLNLCLIARAIFCYYYNITTYVKQQGQSFVITNFFD